MNLFKQIENDIKSKKFSPIYLLMGEEEFYIDYLTNLIIENSISKSEKEFNYNVLYGKETNIDEVISICKKFPLMSNNQVVVLKEAQDLSRTIDKLAGYVNNFLESTILIINYKHKSLDKRKSLYKLISKNGVVFESKRLYENQVQQWIKDQLNNKSIKISNKAIAMIVDFLGTDLSKINNELSKLIQLKKDLKEVSENEIEKYIGISKEYNNFELRNAISEKNTFKAFQIFSQNILVKLIEKGLSREESYKMVQDLAFQAWNNDKNFKDLLLSDKKIMNILNKEELENCFAFNSLFKNAKSILSRVMK